VTRWQVPHDHAVPPRAAAKDDHEHIDTRKHFVVDQDWIFGILLERLLPSTLATGQKEVAF
jgi:hypothetical protein